jgi:hypothetical protein
LTICSRRNYQRTISLCFNLGDTPRMPSRFEFARKAVTFTRHSWNAWKLCQEGTVVQSLQVEFQSDQRKLLRTTYKHTFRDPEWLGIPSITNVTGRWGGRKDVGRDSVKVIALEVSVFSEGKSKRLGLDL